MLVLTRRVGERLILTDPEGRQVTFIILSDRDNQIRIGIEAPRDIEIHREEIYDRIQREGFNK